MNGVAYYRIKRGLSLATLSEVAGVGIPTMERYESTDGNYRGNGNVYLRLSDALGVPIVELIRENYPDIPDPTAKRKQLPSRTANPANPITRYREAHQLSFKELAQRLGNTTRESGRKACHRNVPLNEHIEALASYEGITSAEFYIKYKMIEEVN